MQNMVEFPETKQQNMRALGDGLEVWGKPWENSCVGRYKLITFNIKGKGKKSFLPPRHALMREVLQEVICCSDLSKVFFPKPTKPHV